MGKILRLLPADVLRMRVKGKCPHCGQWEKLDGDGRKVAYTIAKHKSPGEPECRGKGKVPTDVQVPKFY